MAIDPSDIDVEALRERYRIEKEKRVRPDGNKQFKELKGEYAEFDRDPYTERVEREPVVEETEVLIVGGGFGGMLTAIDLTKLGIRDFRLVEKAGDFGGTWYWNRYPGCMCDVESYTYLPLLEDTGYMPTQRYAQAPEIFEYCKLLGRTFDLYENALFQTVISGAVWDDDAHRWVVTTDRGDTIRARFVVVAGGILHKAKLPGHPRHRDLPGQGLPHQPVGLRLHRRQPHHPDGQARRQGRRHHRHRRHRRAGHPAAGQLGQAGHRLPAHALRRRRPRPGPHRRRVVQEPEAGVAAGAHRQLHPERHRRAARGGPRRRRLDPRHVGQHPGRGVVRGGGRRPRAERLPDDGGDPAPRRRDRRRPGDRREAQACTGPRTASGSASTTTTCRRSTSPTCTLVDTDGRGVDSITETRRGRRRRRVPGRLPRVRLGLRGQHRLRAAGRVRPGRPRRPGHERALVRGRPHHARRAPGRLPEPDADQPRAGRVRHQLRALPRRLGRPLRGSSWPRARSRASRPSRPRPRPRRTG